MGYKYIDEHDAIQQYREMLDDAYGDVEIAGQTFTTSHALEELDPTAFRCGMIDWLDSENLSTDADEADIEVDRADADVCPHCENSSAGVTSTHDGEFIRFECECGGKYHCKDDKPENE